MSSLKLYEGYLDKKGKLNKSWKLRYFVLYNNGRLAYYEPTNDDSAPKKQMGFINLSVATGVSTHKYDNTDMLYVIENVTPNIQNTYSPKDELQRRKSSRRPCGQQSIEYIIKIYTPKRVWYLRCKQQQALHEWSTSLKQLIYGAILYESYLLIEENKARWCILTNKYELRIYEDETQSKFQQSLDMQQLNMIRYNDAKEAIPQNYAMIFIWSNKQFTIAASSHRSRDIWIHKFCQLMTNELYILKVLMEGYLLVYKQGNAALSNRKYCVMDSNYHMYFSKDIYTFRCFSQCLYFDIHSFEEEKQNVIDAEISLLRNKHTFKFGKVVNDRMLQLFVVMIQQSNPHVFYIQNNDLIHFVAPSEMELNAWLHCLNQFHVRHCRKTALDIMNGMNLSICIPYANTHEPYANIATISKQKMDEKEEDDDNNYDDENMINILDEITEDNMMDIAAKKDKYWIYTWKKLMKHIVSITEKQDEDEDGMETECSSITECPYFQRIAYLMHFYDDWCCIKSKINAIMRQSINSPEAETPHTPSRSLHETPKQNHFRFKSYVHDSDNEDEDDMKQSGAAAVYDYLNHAFSGYSSTKLLDDYYHIYLHHKSNDDDFNLMHAQLPSTTNAGYNRKCKVTMCDMLKRNERAKGSDVFRHNALRKMYFGYEDVQQVTCMQLLDRIHSLLYHSFDLFRLSENEQKQIKQNNNYYDDYDTDEDEATFALSSCSSDYDSFIHRMSNQSTKNEYIDHRFHAMHRIMKAKQKTLMGNKKHLDRFVAKHPSLTVYIIMKAASTTNETVLFWHDVKNKGLGSKIVSETKDIDTLCGVTGNLCDSIETVDILQFLSNVCPSMNDDDCYISLKIDIEGNEYEILEALISNDKLCIIDELHIEWHNIKKHRFRKQQIINALNSKCGLNRKYVTSPVDKISRYILHTSFSWNNMTFFDEFEDCSWKFGNKTVRVSWCDEHYYKLLN